MLNRFFGLDSVSEILAGLGLPRSDLRKDPFLACQKFGDALQFRFRLE